MTAETTKNTQGRWLAWCEEHQDGYQGGKVTANKWAAKHNYYHHEDADQ